MQERQTIEQGRWEPEEKAERAEWRQERCLALQETQAVMRGVVGGIECGGDGRGVEPGVGPRCIHGECGEPAFGDRRHSE